MLRHAARYPYALISCLVLLLALASHASAAGMLVPRDGSAPIVVDSQRVEAHVENGIARTTVRQTFINPHGRALEAIYLFPVPEGAALVDVAMEVGGKRLEGLLIERKRARRIYDDIVRTKRDPGLVEQVGRSKFRLSVFPVLPNEPTVVELTWTEYVPVRGGHLTYTYPLALAGAEDATTKKDFTLTVSLKSAERITKLIPSVRGMAMRRVAPNHVILSLERLRARLDRDITITASVRSRKPSLQVNTFTDGDGKPGYFAAVLTPPEVSVAEPLPRDITLVIDTSGSMKGEKIEQARAAALQVLATCREGDRMNVLRFDSAVEPFASRPLPLTTEVRQRMTNFIESLSAAGGTAFGDALVAAMRAPVKEGRVGTVVILTDGNPTVGVTEPAALITIAAQGRESGLRVFPFGVGNDVDAGLLGGVASASNGAVEIFALGAEIETRIARFANRTAYPVLSGVELTIDGATAYDIHPRTLPVVFLGEQIVVTGRVREPGAFSAKLTARMAGRPVELTARGVVSSEAAGSIAVRDLFARQKLTELERVLQLRSGLKDDAYYKALDRGAYSTEDEIVAEIVTLSLETGLQSAYTSFLVLLPEDKARIDPTDLAQIEAALERARSLRRKTGGLPADTAGDTEGDSGLVGPSFDEEFADAPFEGPGTNGVIGIGGGAGGRFGKGRGGHRNLKAGGGGRRTQTAVDLALEWLKAHQGIDGRWGGAEHAASCAVDDCCGDPAYDPAVTGTALLCFLGYGETHQSGQYRNVVKNGLSYLKGIQDAEGCFGPRTAPGFMWNHGWAALAMAEAYGMTGSRLFKDPAQRGVNFVHQAQNPYLAWRHGVRDGLGDGLGDGENDTLVSAWMVLVLKSASMAELDVDKKATFGGAVAWFDRVTNPHTGEVGRTARPRGRVGPSVWPEPVLAPPPLRTSNATTAAAVLARIFAGQDPRTTAAMQKSVARIAADPPRWGADEGAIDMTRWYCGTLAMFQVGGPRWKAWNKAMKAAILDRQHSAKDAPERGSWDPVGRQEFDGGRVYSTALMCLCKEVYYRYGKVFGTR